MIYFFLRRHQWFPGNQLERSVDVTEIVLDDFTGYVAGFHKIFRDPVFQTVVAQNHQMTAGTEQFQTCVEQVFEGSHFVVHLDAQCLEHLSEVTIALPPNQRIEQREELSDGSEGFHFALFGDAARQGFGIAYFPVLAKDRLKVFGRIVVEYIGGGTVARLIHAHVQVGIETEGKPPLGCVELVTADAQVGENARQGTGSVPVQTHELPDVAKIMGNERQPIVFRQIPGGVRVLIEGNEPSVGTECVQNKSGMTAATKSSIDVGPAFVNN